jgi:hypothetical protein
MTFDEETIAQQRILSGFADGRIMTLNPFSTPQSLPGGVPWSHV